MNRTPDPYPVDSRHTCELSRYLVADSVQNTFRLCHILGKQIRGRKATRGELDVRVLFPSCVESKMEQLSSDDITTVCVSDDDVAADSRVTYKACHFLH
jgi:hypothetical protein